MTPSECSTSTQNAVSADNVSAEYQQNNYGAAPKFTLVRFDYRTNPSTFALLQKCLQEARCEKPKSFINLKQAKIYEVCCDGFDPDNFEFGNCMMLHGTSLKRSRKILNEGYKNSACGYFGKGVYMTNSLDMAVYYSLRKTLKNWKDGFSEQELKKTYVFVNQVSKSKSLKIKKYKSYNRLADKYTAPKHLFCKYMHKDSPDSKMKEDNERKYYKKIPGLSLSDEYVADDSLVKPRFFIVLEPSSIDYKKYSSFNEFLVNKIK